MRAFKYLATSIVFISSAIFMPLSPTSAQEMQPPPAGMMALRLCSTTNYTEVAAKALNLSALDLRKSLAKGKLLTNVATEQKVSQDTLVTALQEAQKVEIDQAVKDGVLTKVEADMMANVQGNMMITGPMQGDAPMNPMGTPPADGMMQFGPKDMLAAQYGIFAETHIEPVQVAADLLSTTCADLVKILVTTKDASIASIAKSRKVDPQTIIDAVLKAMQDAAEKDKSDGIVIESAPDGSKVDLKTVVSDAVNKPFMSDMMQPFSSSIGNPQP